MSLLPALIQPLSHQTTLLFLAQLTLLLVVARLLGEGARRLNQPAVAGELLAGLLLGPSVLGQLAPHWQAALFPADQLLSDLLAAFSLLGVLMLLVVTGLEIDLKLIRRRIRTAAAASAGGLLIPFLFGLALGTYLPDSYLANPDQRVIFSLFMAVIMSISAIPVIAKVLMDLKAIRRDVGQLILAAAMLDDAVGWVLLSVAAGLAVRGHVTVSDIGYSLTTSVTVMGLGLWLGRSAVDKTLRWVDQTFGGEGPQLTAVIFAALGMSMLTHALRLESMLGAFLAGILVGQSSRTKSQVAHTLELFTGNFFAPIFFASAGLKVNLASLFTPSQMLLCLTVVAIASLGKYLGCYLGGWWGGLSHWERVALGSGMNPRGAMGVIVARIGLSLGILTSDTYSVLISMALLTSLAAPPLLRWSLGKVSLSPEEASRLSQPLRSPESFLRSLRKILLPSRGGTNAQWAAHLLAPLRLQEETRVTALFALPEQGEKPPPEVIQRLQQELQSLPQAPKSVSAGPARIKITHTQDPGSAILQEAETGRYDLLVLGATGSVGESSHPLVDAVLGSAPCSTLVVKAHPAYAGEAIQLRKVLLPAVGTQYSRRAAEVAAQICHHRQATLTVLHVVPGMDGERLGPRAHELALGFAQKIVDEHADLARALGAAVDTLVLEGASPSQTILEEAANGQYDLIFMGTTLRPAGGYAFLGHRAERIVRSSACAAAVISTG